MSSERSTSATANRGLDRPFDRPIMIASLGRSGSTLLQRLLNTHPDITIWGEHAGHLRHIANLIDDTIGDDAFRQRLERNVEFRDQIVGPLSDPAAFNPWAAPLGYERFREAIADFVASLFGQDLPLATRWGFKEIRYGPRVYERMRFLFPEATVLVVVRDLPGYLRSRLRAWRPNVAKDAVDRRAAMMEAVEKSVATWLKRNRALLALVETAPGSYMSVPYSRFSTEPAFVNALIQRLVGTTSELERLQRVLRSRAGSSDQIANDDWDPESTSLLFDVVDVVTSHHPEAEEIHERSLESSVTILEGNGGGK